MTTRRTHDRSTVGDLLAAMTAWPHPERVAAGLHPGDLGWHLRLTDAAIAGQIVGWWDGDDLVAVGLLEGVVGRFSVRPGLERDGVLGLATAWWTGEGGTAILEPVATHHDHRGRGWGVRGVTALVSRLRDLGASGVSVSTPVEYVGAAATYRSAGLHPVEQFSSLVRSTA